MLKLARSLCAVLLCLGLCVAGYAEPTAKLVKKHSSKITHTTTRKASHKRVVHTATKKTTHVKKSSSRSSSARVTSHRRRTGRAVLAVRRTRRHHYVERFTASSYTDNLTLGDVTAGEDPVVRAAAIEALGNMNGTAVAINPDNGRILAMVNQKLALSRGAEPCSTIKLTVALAALEEGIITKDTPVNLGHGYKVDLTYALAKSVNSYFEVLGRTLGFERVKHYANQFGLGELAGYHIQGEQLGVYPDHVLPEKLGGVGRMCSFGESISMTPLQLGAIVSAIANGGTLYYLQHPETPEEVANFKPMVKRTLNIAPIIPEIVPGMAGAVDSRFGTARSLRTSFNEFPVMGKTGTCSNDGTRFGWFASYANTPNGRIVTVFFLEGGRPTFGPKAAELTGQFYRALWDKSYFVPKPLVETGSLGGN
ncbi:MAG TPA: penicillin-binding transpeptidase domain-containing protein [Edaphobacter sp.]|nr:penicillin-binding transpeptidase domain-containing protein [Edaphobacter sp.]